MVYTPKNFRFRTSFMVIDGNKNGIYAKKNSFCIFIQVKKFSHHHNNGS